MTTLEFLSELYGNFEAGYIYLWTTPDKLSHWYPVTSLEEAARAAESLSAGRKNVYYGLGLTATAKQADERATVPDVTMIPGLWVELDLRDDTHPGNPTTIDELVDLVQAWPLPPSIIVRSGHGIHAYWLFKEPWDITGERDRAADLLQRFQAMHRQTAAAQGWKVDSTHDLARVLRLPGTMNYKAEPVPVATLAAGPERYNPDDFEQFLPDSAPAAVGEHRASRFERRATDGPAGYMLANCMFMQHCQLNAKSLSYQEWLAALTNLVRASDGIQAAHAVSALDPARYNPKDTDKKIDECLAAMHPQTCQYIAGLGFAGCPPGGCGIQAPCGWSLGKLPQAKALIRSLSVPTPETVYTPQVMGALALIQKEAPAEYDVFFQRCKGQVNLNTLRAEVKKQRVADSGFTVYEGGENVQENAETVHDSDENVPARFLGETVPDVPLNLQLPRHSNNAVWFFRQKGITLKRTTQNGDSYLEVSYAPILITERIYNVDTFQEKARITFRTPRHGWRSVVLPKSVIFDARKIMALADAGFTVNSEMAKGLVKWLAALEAANSDIIPQTSSVSKLGWRREREFILPGKDARYIVDAEDLPTQNVITGFAVVGDYGVWLEAMRHLRTKPRARFILAASFAAPLLKIVGQRIFAVYNWGESRDGKSAALHAAMSVWGRPEDLIISANSSATGIERTAEILTDLPLGINEYETVADRKKPDFIDPVIYMLSEGKGRQRGTRTGLQRVASWRTIAIMNGENSLVTDRTKGGIVTRVLEVYGGPLKDDQVFASNLYRITDRNHGHAGQAYIEQLLQANHDELRDTYNGVRFAFRQKYPQLIEAHLDAVSCLALADQLAGIWIFGENEDEAGRAAIAMAETIIGELSTKDETDGGQRAWAWLQDWLAANASRFDAYAKNTLPLLGYNEGDGINIIKSELISAMRREGYPVEKVLRLWADQGRIACTVENGKRRIGVKGRRINGVQPWLIKIKEE